MTHNTKELEALDRKWGRTVVLADWERLGEKADADLTADDLVIIEAFSGPKHAAARRASRALARSPAHAPEAIAAHVAETIKQHHGSTTPRATVNVDEMANIFVAIVKRTTKAMQAKISLLEGQLAEREQAIDPTNSRIKELETILNARICPRCRSGKLG